ncbi:MAG: hypothetical protein IKH26_05190, partial [Bacteroidaceae bacterium]|nr:hypothetical protein [Bacteroidaceae bacterium]
YNTRIISGTEGNPGMAAVDNELALFTKFGTTYGTDLGYTMPLAANTLYKFTFKYGAFGENKEIVTNLALASEDGETTVSISPASFTRANNSGLANSDPEAWFDYVGYFKIEEAGNYVLTLTKNDNGQQRQIVMANISILSHELETAELTLASSGYTSWVTTFDVDFNGLDVEAYIVEPDDIDLDNMKIDMTQIYNAAKGTPVIFKGTASAPFTLTETVESVTDWTATNKLKSGTDCGLKIDDSNYGYVWMFSKGTFKRCQNGINLNATKAYLVLDAPIRPDGDINFRADFGDGEANAINGIVDADSAPKAIYNLQGQKVNAPVKGGIYIINGKKTLVK